MPARHLYCSDWFKKASRYAQCISDQWFILSAKYGLVHPDQVIAPYDKTLHKMSTTQRRIWARKITPNIKKMLFPGDKVMFLAFQKYREHFIKPVEDMGCAVKIPMEGLRIGEQKHWLKQRLEKLDA